MSLRAICVLAGLMSAFGAAAQEPETYYPYETETEERTPVLLTDSVLFYRAVQSSPDLYAQITDYNFSFVRVSRRGQGYGLQAISVEGLPLAMRYSMALRALGAEEARYAGSEPADEALGLTNGVRVFRFAEAEPSPAGRIAVNFTDRNYLVGARFSYAGMLGRGWSIAAAADARTGRDLHVEGVFTNALTASFRAEKRYGQGHRIAVLVVVPPSMRGLRSSSTEEVFVLTGDRLYNPAWGFQDGKVRNARIRRECMPLLMANGVIVLSQTTEMAVAMGAEAGVSKFSTLGWYDARTPLPDNYRSLPSYTADRETEEAWRMCNPRYTQVDWDELWAENRMGCGEAVYALEDRVERICNLRMNVGFTTRFDNRLTLHYGVSAMYESVRNYKQMRDLLGATYRTDIDQFLVDDDTYGNRLQNDLRYPNRRIGEGDRFGYDYAFRNTGVGVRMLMQYRADRFRADLGGEICDESVCREGYFEKELFPGAGSFGRSAVLRFTPYTFKLAAGWAFSPRSYLGAVLTAAATMPEADALFLQSQYNNRTADHAGLRKLWAAEVAFNRMGRVLDLRIAAFAVSSRDGMAAYRYYDDLAGAFCDMSVTGIGLRSYGIEAAALIRFTYRWQLSTSAAVGSYAYAADPHVSVVTDTDNTFVDRTTSRMGGCRVGNAPQITGCVGATYFGRKGWGFRAAANAAVLRYAEPALLRRTERLVRQVAQTPEAFELFTKQERLNDAFTLDASVFKTFYFNESRLTVSLMARNLLGSRDLVYSAYESLRVRRSRSGDMNVYAPSETSRQYAYPRSFYLSVSYRY